MRVSRGQSGSSGNDSSRLKHESLTGWMTTRSRRACMVLDAGDVSVTGYCTDKSLLRSCQDCRNWHSAAWLRDLEPFTRLHTRVWSGLDHSLHDQHQIENSPSWQLASA